MPRQQPHVTQARRSSFDPAAGLRTSARWVSQVLHGGGGGGGGGSGAGGGGVGGDGGNPDSTACRLHHLLGDRMSRARPNADKVDGAGPGSPNEEAKVRPSYSMSGYV